MYKVFKLENTKIYEWREDTDTNTWHVIMLAKVVIEF